MEKYTKFCLAYRQKYTRSKYQLGIWEDFKSLEECEELYNKYKYSITNKIYNIALLDEENKTKLLYDI